MHVSLVTLGVADLNASARFYEAMGWERSGASVEGTVAFLQGGTVVLGLYPIESFTREVGRAGSAAQEAVALATNVSSAEVVDSLLEAAGRAGGTVVRPGGHMDWGGYSGYFADLDGHLWEVAHNPHAELEADGRLVLEPGGDHLTPDEVQAFLADFREQTDRDPGPMTVDEVAEAAAAILVEAGDRVRAVLEGVPTNTVIAAMTELTNRAVASAPGSNEQMALSAASNLVSSRLG